MKNKILNIASLVFGLLLINGGLNKFFNYMPVPDNLPKALMEDTRAMMEISWLMPLFAIVELLGGILIIIPKTRALGALIIFPVMVGILLVHLFVEPSGLPIAIIIWIILIWIILENWRKYKSILD